MKINIEELERLPNKAIALQIGEVISEFSNDYSVTGGLTITSLGFVVTVTGKVASKINLECDRCLKKFTFDVNADVSEKYVKDSIIPEGKEEFEITEENFVVELNGSNEIDINDLVYQALLLNIPSQKLCNKDCKGSEEYQSLSAEEKIDPRLQIFKDITDKLSK